MKIKFKKIAAVITAAAMPFAFALPAFAEGTGEAPVKVACVGDSITQGLGNTPYPSRLADLLGEGYDVQNFGLWGTTGCNNTARPYTTCDDSRYQSSLDFKPDIVILMLGTNDGNQASVENAKLYFKQDMTALIRSYQALDSQPTVYLVTSPYAYLDGNAPVNTEIVKLQRELADELELPMIDMNKLTQNMPENFQDQLHPSESGYYLIAQNFYELIFKGKVADVTVKTAPNAKVKISAYETKADANGVATIRMAQGKRLLSVEASGYEPAFAEIDITNNCVITCELSQKMNIASEGTVISTGEAGEDNKPEKAFDGDLSTGWQNSSKTTGVSVGVELEKNRTFSSVKLYWETVTRPGTDENSYTVEYFDGTNWQAVENPVYTFGNGNHASCCDTVTFDSIAAKGVRVVVNTFTNDKSAPKLYEMAVYGDVKGEAKITVTEAEKTDDASSDGKEAENSSLPGWVIPVAAAAVALVIIACIVWIIVGKKQG